jgi:hypothetical protein
MACTHRKAGADGGDADVVCLAQVAQGASEVHHSSLGGGVHWGERDDEQPANGGRVHNHAASTLHMLQVHKTGAISSAIADNMGVCVHVCVLFVCVCMCVLCVCVCVRVCACVRATKSCDAYGHCALSACVVVVCLCVFCV